jgi:hypothetical protein
VEKISGGNCSMSNGGGDVDDHGSEEGCNWQPNILHSTLPGHNLDGVVDFATGGLRLMVVEERPRCWKTPLIIWYVDGARIAVVESAHRSRRGQRITSEISILSTRSAMAEACCSRGSNPSHTAGGGPAFAAPECEAVKP